MNYQDFTVRIRDFQEHQFKVEVLQSPVGQMRDAEAVAFAEAELAPALRRLERKRISQAELMALGERLAALLFPTEVRTMLVRSLDTLGEDQGLRIRLMINEPRLANLPWEYVYLQRGGGERGIDGFLGLDPHISMVRHEALGQKPGTLTTQGPLKLVVGLAGPDGEAPLDLAEERSYVEDALADIAGIAATFVDHLTVEKFEKAIQGAHIFHFGGHGAFMTDGPGADGTRHVKLIESNAAPPTVSAGTGMLVFEAEGGGRRLFAADKLAQNLATLRLVVLGACETGRRDGVNVWSGIAPALMRVGIPAAVAMQYTVYDRSAIAFARRFYQAIASRLTLDEAVIAGRLAVLNLDLPYSLDFGVPVLYLQTADGVLFPAAVEDQNLISQREEAQLVIRQRMQAVRGTVTGLVIGASGLPDSLQADIEQTIDRVEAGGIVTGAVFGGAGGNVHIGGEQKYVTNRSVFDQRGQAVHGTQTNIEGSVQMSGGTFNSGAITRATSKVSVVEALRSLLSMVTQAGDQGLLDDEQVIDLEGALRKALRQIEKIPPDRAASIGHLQRAQTMIAEVAVARDLATAIGAVREMIERQG